MTRRTRCKSVNELADNAMEATAAKTDAARIESQAETDAESDRTPPLERVESILHRADQVGEPDPDFDMKAYTDEMWGDMQRTPEETDQPCD